MAELHGPGRRNKLMMSRLVNDLAAAGIIHLYMESSAQLRHHANHIDFIKTHPKADLIFVTLHVRVALISQFREGWGWGHIATLAWNVPDSLAVGYSGRA